MSAEPSKPTRYERLHRNSPTSSGVQGENLADIITQVNTDDSTTPLKLNSNFAFRWFSVLCSCFRASNSDLRNLRCNSSEPLLGPQSPEFQGRKTLILDLDETLVHSSFKPTKKPDIVIPIEIDGKTLNVFVGKRPGVDEFLARVGELFEVVIFTASLAKVTATQYANPLIEQLDTLSVVSSRLFRESCVFTNGCYVKDLSRIGRDMSQLVIIDVNSR